MLYSHHYIFSISIQFVSKCLIFCEKRLGHCDKSCEAPHSMDRLQIGFQGGRDGESNAVKAVDGGHGFWPLGLTWTPNCQFLDRTRRS